jgi:hypothetical protein
MKHLPRHGQIGQPGLLCSICRIKTHPASPHVRCDFAELDPDDLKMPTDKYRGQNRTVARAGIELATRGFFGPAHGRPRHL